MAQTQHPGRLHGVKLFCESPILHLRSVPCHRLFSFPGAISLEANLPCFSTPFLVKVKVDNEVPVEIFEGLTCSPRMLPRLSSGSLPYRS